MKLLGPAYALLRPEFAAARSEMRARDGAAARLQLFFGGTDPTHQTLSALDGLRRLFRRAGVLTSSGRPPRVHDLRHTHAVHVLARWYRAGLDVQARLPALATSMGHVSIVSTAYYLSLLEPIARAASGRFAAHCHDVLASTEAQGVER